MKIRVTTSVLSLLFVIAFGILCTVYTNRLCSDLSQQAKHAASEYDRISLLKVKERWDNNVPVLSALIPHEHVDGLSASLNKALAFLKNEDKNEFDAEISWALHQFDIIGKYDKPSFRALF